MRWFPYEAGHGTTTPGPWRSWMRSGVVCSHRMTVLRALRLDGGAISLSIETIFLSRKKGAIYVALASDTPAGMPETVVSLGAAVASVKLDYLEAAARALEAPAGAKERAGQQVRTSVALPTVAAASVAPAPQTWPRATVFPSSFASNRYTSQRVLWRPSVLGSSPIAEPSRAAFLNPRKLASPTLWPDEQTVRGGAPRS